MKKFAGLTATVLAMLLCLGMFAGCSETEESSSSETSSESSSETSSDTSSETSVSQEESSGEAVEGDVIGEITYVGSTTLVLDVYEADSEVTDYTDMEGVALTDTEESRTITLEDGAVFQSVSEGALTEITIDDVAEGDMVAVTTDEDGAQTVTVLDVEIGSDVAENDDTAQSTNTAETSALEEAAGKTDSSAA